MIRRITRGESTSQVNRPGLVQAHVHPQALEHTGEDTSRPEYATAIYQLTTYQ